MDNNRMAEVAKMFGVELGESFKLTDDIQGDYRQYYQFTDKKGLETSVDGVKWKTVAAEILRDILMGDIRIVRLPWKPKMRERYYYPIPSDRNLWESCLWVDDNYDNNRFSRGLVCKTEKEAVELARQMLAVVKEVENNGKAYERSSQATRSRTHGEFQDC